MHTLRLAYATQFPIAVIAVYVLWSQVGGQSHLDLMPWYVKLGLGAGAAVAVVKATAAAVSKERAWNGRTLKWLGISAGAAGGVRAGELLRAPVRGERRRPGQPGQRHSGQVFIPARMAGISRDAC